MNVLQSAAFQGAVEESLDVICSRDQTQKIEDKAPEPERTGTCVTEGPTKKLLCAVWQFVVYGEVLQVAIVVPLDEKLFNTVSVHFRYQ
jgi:hypothetical protein